MILNLYVPHNRFSKYMKQKLIYMPREVDNVTLTVDNFSTPFKIINRTSRQKIIKDIEALNYTINWLNLGLLWWCSG